MRKYLTAALLSLGLVAVSTPALTQASPHASAEITAVRKGVFVLKPGESVDLTDRGILLTLVRIDGNPGDPSPGIVYTVNGAGTNGGNRRGAGFRLDLKTFGATQDVVRDLRACALDVVSVAKPVGGDASVKFRLLCE